MAITVNPEYTYQVISLKRRKYNFLDKDEFKRKQKEEDNKEIADADNLSFDVVEDKILILKDKVEELKEKIGIFDIKVELEIQGKELEGIKAKHPFLDRQSIIILGSETTLNVEKDTGTGLVHTAPRLW